MTSSLAALLLMGARADSSCFQTNVQYVGNRVIAPGYVHSAEFCQGQCQTTYACAYFTWKASGNATAHQGAGACLKYDSQATLVPVDDNGTVSGPVRCPSASATNTTGQVPAIANTSTTVPIFPPPQNGTAANATNGTNITAPTEHMGGNGGFPWWAILLIALVVVGVCAGVLFGMRDGKSKKTSKKTKRSGKVKKESRSTAAAVEAGEAAALMRTEAPPPMVENVSVDNVVMPPPAAMPAPPVPDFQMAAPVGTNMMAFQQPMAAYMQPQGVVQMQPQGGVQMQQVPVVQTILQPQFR